MFPAQPLTLYMVLRSILIGLLELVTEDERYLISEKAACRAYHCAEYCLRPSTMVKGSVKSHIVNPDGKFFFDGGAAGEELDIVVVIVSSHNRAFCESHDCKAVKDRFLTSSTLPMSSFWGL